MRKKIQLSLFLTLLIFGVQGKFATLIAGPSVDFTYSGVCVGSPTIFTGSATGLNAVNWSWEFGDGKYGNGSSEMHTYAGANTSPGYTVILTVIDDLGITYTATKVVAIQLLPIPAFSFDTPNCSNNSIQFTDHSVPTDGYIKQWIWNFDDGSPSETVLSLNDPNIKHVFPISGTFYVSLKVMNSVNSCENTAILPIVVMPSPIANFYFDGKCEDQIVTFTDASFANGAGNISTWNWDFGDPTSGSGQNTSNLPDPIHFFANAGMYKVRLIVKNFNNCSDTIEKQVTINPSPPVGFTYTPICLQEPVSFSPDPSITNLPSIATWHWDFGDGIPSYASNPDHTYWVSGDYPVTLTVTDLLGCKKEATQTVKVNALPVAQFSTNFSYCAGAEVQFQDMSSISPSAGYIDRWEWDFGDGNILIVNHPDNPDVSHSYALDGNYTVKLTIKSSQGCIGISTHLLIIHPNPIANFAFTKSCAGTPTAFTDLSQANGTGSIVDWQWDFGDPGSGTSNFSSLQHPVHSFVVSGNSIVRLIVTTGNGCSDTIVRTVKVNLPSPVNFNTTNNCQNSEVDFTPDASVMNLAAIKLWYWEFGDNVSSVLQNPKHTFTTAGAHNVILTIVDTAGCTSTISWQVIIAPEPLVNFSFPQPACNQSLVQFNNLSSVPGSGYIVKSEWDFGDGTTQTLATLTSVFHTYRSYGSFTVKLTVTSNNGCIKTLSLPIVILPTPIADFSFSGTCLNSPVQFNDQSQPGVGGIISLSWKFGDPTSGSNNESTAKFPTHAYNTTGTFPVRLVVSNSGGCFDTIIKQVRIHGLPAVDFTSTSGCVNESTHFVSSTFVNAGAIVSRSWNFGDGHVSQSMDPSNTYATSGSFVVTLTVIDTAGCVNTKNHIVVIAESPSALFEVSPSTCSGKSISFSVIPSASTSTITSYLWEFGDGSSMLVSAPASGSVSHTYASGNNYTVVLTVQTALGCKSKSQRTFTVYSDPVAQFNFANSCSGAAVNFKDLSQANSGPSIVNWSWNFGDPSSTGNNTSILKNPSHVFNTAGTYKVLLQVENSSGCTDTVSKSILINPKPTADFDWSGSCMGNTTKFSINNTVTNVASIASYSWDFGDGTAHSSIQNPVHKYTIASNYTVILTVVTTAGCTNSVSHLIDISPQPIASFNSNSTCLGSETQFTDQSYASGGVPITAWRWDFGVNTISNDTSGQKNPSWVYTSFGVYQVKLTVTSQNGCQNTATLPSQVFGNPTANFTYAVSPCGNGAVYFEDSSYNKQAPIVSFNWEFENHYSNLQDPVYIFYSPDSCYDVRLIATDVRGCVDTVVKKTCVPAEFNFSFVASNTCLYDSTYFTPQQLGYSTGTLVSFFWNFGDPKTSSNNNSTKKSPSHYYDQPGTYTVSLQATDIYNCLRIVYREITILPLPVSYFTYTQGACDSSIYFNDASYSAGSEISKWTWNFGDGEIQTIIAPDSADLSHKYAVPGRYTVGLTVSNLIGCSIQTSVNEILVKPCLTAAFELSDKLICQNNTLSFYDMSSSTNTSNKWYWDFGDGTHTEYTKYTNRINHVFKTSGPFKVQLILSTYIDGRIVSDTSVMNVNVNPTPLPDFTFGVVCHEQTAEFTNMTSGNGTKISNYNWTFGEPSSDPQDTSTMKNPVHLYNTPGTYQVGLKVKNMIGCMDSIRKSLIVHGLPDANYKYAISCAGDNTAFTDLSVAAVAPIAKWEWTYFDEKGVAGKTDVQNPGFIFSKPGDYLVNLKVTDIYGCFDTINQHVTTWSVPISLFSYTENYKEVQGQLQFANLSVEAVKYYWDFGEGTDSYTENPEAYYTNDGTYTITLITWNDKECSDTLSMKYDFMVKGLFIPNAFSPTNPKTEVQLLKPVGLNLDQYLFEVYDRWGNILWWTDKLDAEGRPLEGWDGKYKGNLMPEGAYPWRAFGLFKDGSIWDAENIGNNDNLPKFKVGTATMIR